MGSRSATSSRTNGVAEPISPLERWGRTQEYGWRTRLMHSTKPRGSKKPAVGWATIMRACRGVKVNLHTAKRISRATGGAVPYEALTDERDALEVA